MDNVSQAYGQALLESVAEEAEHSSHEKTCWIEVYAVRIQQGYSPETASISAARAVEEFREYFN